MWFVFQPRSQLADISELDLKKGTNINFPEGKDKLLHFEIKIQPEEGTYKYVFHQLCSPAALCCTSECWLQSRDLPL